MTQSPTDKATTIKAKPAIILTSCSKAGRVRRYSGTFWQATLIIQSCRPYCFFDQLSHCQTTIQISLLNSHHVYPYVSPFGPGTNPGKDQDQRNNAYRGSRILLTQNPTSTISPPSGPRLKSNRTRFKKGWTSKSKMDPRLPRLTVSSCLQRSLPGGQNSLMLTSLHYVAGRTEKGSASAVIDGKAVDAPEGDGRTKSSATPEKPIIE